MDAKKIIEAFNKNIPYETVVLIKETSKFYIVESILSDKIKKPYDDYTCEVTCYAMTKNLKKMALYYPHLDANSFENANIIYHDEWFPIK